MFEVKIASPGDGVKTHTVERLTVPTTDGFRTLLARHVDTVMALAAGPMTLINGSDREELTISDGIFYFSDNRASVLVHSYGDAQAEAGE